MKQYDMFGKELKQDEDSYTSKIKAPTYEPKNKKPHILELLDGAKVSRMIREIQGSNVSEDEKKFLIEAARRHNVFNYSKVADYYAHASGEMQSLMERSALVVVDFNKAYEYGYIRLAHDIAGLYLDTMPDE